MTNADDEVAALDRVLTRLALTEEDQLEKVLERLIPAVIDQLKSPHDATRKKVMEMLAHVNKRLQGQKGIRLPLDSLLELFLNPKASPMTRNFALVYVETAFKRASPEERFLTVQKLLGGVSQRPQLHREMLLRLAVAALEQFAVMPRDIPPEAEFCSKYAFLSSAGDTAAFLSFALKLLLYQPSSGGRQRATPLSVGLSTMQPAEGRGRSQNPPGALGAMASGIAMPVPGSAAFQALNQERASPSAATSEPPVIGGLSQADISMVVGKEPPSGETLRLRKVGILNFTAASGLDPSRVVELYIVAAADPDDRVATRGEELLRKRCGMDSQKPVVNLESDDLVRRLFRLFHGTSEESSVPPSSRVAPASPAVRARLMALFTKSAAAANCAPHTFKAVFACIYGSDTTVKLKQAGMEFAVWVFKHAATDQLTDAAPGILKRLVDLLDDKNGAAGSESSMVTLRGFTYQAIAQLGERVPSALQSDTDVPRRFFHALAVEMPGIRANLQEALSALAGAYKGCSGSAREDIRQLLLEGIANFSEGVRFCAVQWAIRLFPFDDVTARYICVLATADKKLEVKEAGHNGLKPEPFKSKTAAETVAYPPLPEMVEYLRQKHARFRRAPDAADKLVLEPKAFVALIGFLRECRGEDMKSAPLAATSDNPYQDLLEHALVRDGTAELHEAAFAALLETASAANVDCFAERFSKRVAWLKGFLWHVDEEDEKNAVQPCNQNLETRSQVRSIAAKVLGITVSKLSGSEAEQLLQQMVASFRPQGHKFEERCGALVGAGFALSQCATGHPTTSLQTISGVERAMASCLRDGNVGVASAAARGIGAAGLRAPLHLDEGKTAEPAPAQAEQPESASDSGPPSYKSKDNAAPVQSRADVVAALSVLAEGRDSKASAKAAAALGFLAGGETSTAILEAIFKALVSLSNKKGDELQFAVGEALCFAYGGVPVTADAILRTGFRSLSTQLTATESDHESGSPTDMETDDKDMAQPTAARPAFQERVLAVILDEYIYHTRTEVRSAACIWLLSIVSFTARSAALTQRLSDIQEAFGHLLGDGNELIQEMASRGISAVYRLGTEAHRKELLAGLMSSLTGGAKKRRAVKVTGETRVFEEGALGEAPGGGSLSTYRELCSLATDMGQPDLVYRFMDLANHAASLNSSRGAAFGFASIAKMAGEQMEPYVAQLVPKLYRYQYDPNPRVRDGMTNIWRVLVGEPRKAVDAHFDAILSELLREMGGRLWRNREAAALALSELLQGRRWPDVKSRFEEIWTMAFRALDDIKESVRSAATGLIRTLRGLTLRLADPQYTPTAEATAAIAVTLPFLLKSGLASSVAEVQALALTTIAKVVQMAQPEQIREHLPDLVAALLESLSGMEDSRVNYVEQHAEKLGLDADKLENLRVSASRSSPMGDTLELCARYTDAPALDALLPRLTQLVRRGVGLNTRVGTARFLTSLTLRVGRDMKPHAGGLMKALVGAAKSENSAAVRRAYASCAAQIAKYAPEPQTAKLVSDAVDLYVEPGGASSRQLAGVLVRELARQAPETFAAHASQVMPLAFIAGFDEDTGVAGLWRDVWDEESSSETASLRLYIAEILGVLLQGLESQQWERKRTAAKAIVQLCESGPDAIGSHAQQVAAALLQEVPGRIWDGKESVLAALAALCKAAPARFADPSAAASARAVVNMLVSAAQRPKASFRSAAVAALETALRSLDGDFYDEAGPLLCEELDRAVAAQQKKQGSEEEGRPQPLPVSETVRAMAAAWTGTGLQSCLKWGRKHASSLAPLLNPGLPWAVRAAALSAAQDFAAHLQQHSDMGEEQISWLEILIPGIAAATEEQRISQVRGTALDCLAQFLDASQGGKRLSQGSIRALWQHVEALAAGEKNPGLQARALALRDQLPPEPMATDK